MAVDQRVGSAVRRTDRGSGSGGERITCPDAAGRQGAGRDRLDLEQRHVWIRRLGNVKSTGSDTFVYDAFGRLTSGTAGAAHSQAYTYDVFGNILTITTDGSTATRANLGVDPATNRISRSSDPVTGAPYNAFGTYDARGNMISNALGDTFRYDALDRLAESTVGGVRKVYLYGPDDERIASFTISPSWSADWTLRDPGGRVLRRYRQSGNGDWSWSQDYIYRDGQLLASDRKGPPLPPRSPGHATPHHRERRRRALPPHELPLRPAGRASAGGRRVDEVHRPRTRCGVAGLHARAVLLAGVGTLLIRRSNVGQCGCFEAPELEPLLIRLEQFR